MARPRPGAEPDGRLRSTELVTALAEPSAVVVVGASADPRKASGRPLDYLRRFGFGGTVCVVNPRHDSVAGYPCVASIDDIPAGRFDAAIVNLPAGDVTAALHGLDRRGVRSAVVIGSGFELSESVARREILAFLDTPGRGLRVVGPNCVGTMSPASGTHLNFSSVLQTTAPRPGGAALVTQSGATGNGILMSLLRRGAGLSHWFSTGDELDAGALELTAGLLPRPEVSCIGLFVEGITDIEWLPEVRRGMAEYRKQVFVVKVADTDLGQLAAGGHTGRVVGSKDISRAVLAQAGFVRLESVAELADCLVVNEIAGRLPRTCAVAAVSVSGAGAVTIADHIRAWPALRMPRLEGQVAAGMNAIAGGRIAITNPLDVPFLDETETFAGLIATASASAVADVVLAVESSLVHDRGVLTAMLRERPRDAAPIVLTHLSEDDTIPADLVVLLAGARVAVVPTPERAADVIGHLTDSGGSVLADHGGSVLADHGGSVLADHGGLVLAGPVGPERDETRRGQLMGLDAIAGLLPADFPWARWVAVADASQARAAVIRLGLPAAIKAAGRSISHRTDVGAVELVRNGSEVAEVFARIAAICRGYDDDVVVQEGVPAGQELLLACVRDPEYGLAAVLRPGGTLAELLDEQVVLWHGWAPADRLATLSGSRLGSLIRGYRQQAGSDLTALCALVETVLAAMAESAADFLEFNPVVMTTDGIRVLDAIGTSRETAGTNARTES
jgi:acetate---CoA ligase (ADP-forming)